MIRRILRYALVVILLLAAFIFLNNTNLFVDRAAGTPVLAAHRGIAQRFDAAGIGRDTCTATRIHPPTHTLLENTIPSMRAAFDAGADVIELDVHPTTDGQFAVFHDWTLDCRTNGTGVTREHTMAELRRFDLGWGYTADGGKTFPLRGQGVGMMPTLDEVLAAFPGRRFAVNVKSNDPHEGELLAAYLGRLTPAQRSLLFMTGGDRPLEVLKRLMPEMKVMSRSTIAACGQDYIAYGWTGLMPGACRGTVVLIPVNVAPWLWGWPDRLLNRFESVGTEVFVTGPYDGGGSAGGLDIPDDLARLPQGYSGGIWTDEIERVARLVKGADGKDRR